MDKYFFTLPELLYALRLSKNLKQTDFAKLIGLSQSSVSKYEKGIFDESHLNIIHLRAIFSHFNLDFNIIERGLFIEAIPKECKKVKKSFRESGIFKAKTIFYLCEEIGKTKNTYELISLPRVLFAFSSQKYGLNLIKEIYKISPELFKQSLKKLNSNEERTNKDYIKVEKLQALAGFLEVTQINIDASEMAFIDYEIKLDSSLEITDLLHDLIRLEAQLMLNASIKKVGASKGLRGKWHVPITT